MKLLLIGVLASFPAITFADIAVETSQKFQLYYVDTDEDLLRSDCSENASVLDRATCSSNTATGIRGGFFFILNRSFGQNLDNATQQASDAWVNIQRVDTRLLEMAAGQTPNDPASPTLEDLNQALGELNAKEIVITEIRDQIARIQRVLGQRADPDLVEQLEIYRTLFSGHLTEQGELQENLSSLRELYVAARVQDTNQDYLDLMAMREEFLTAWATAQRAVNGELEDIADGERLATRLRDNGFTWISRRNRMFPGIHHLASAFDLANVQRWTFANQNRGAKVAWQTDRGGQLADLNCRFASESGELIQNTCAIALIAPGGRQMTQWVNFNPSGMEVVLTPSSCPEKFAAEGFLDPGITAEEWRFQSYCAGWDHRPPASFMTTCELRYQFQP